jgi:hypothetical protein
MTPRRAAVMALLLFTLHAHAQPPTPVLRQRAITFSNTKPVLGLPSDVTHVSGLCSSDGLTYFDTFSNASLPRDIYTISTTAEVKHLLRKLPAGFTHVSAKGFYPSDHALVTLLEADKRDDSDSQPREIESFLSTSNHDGGLSDLLALDFHFKPLKIAAFASGDFLILGWDSANELPVLAMLNEDGTIRRFIDLDEMQRPEGSATRSMDLISAAAFVPFGDDILLTFPGTTHPLRLLRATGQDRSIALSIPAGFVLHDVLGSDGRYTLVARVEAMPSAEQTKTPAPPPEQRLLEFPASGGRPLQEFTFDKVPIAAVTCAARSSLTAVYLETKGTPAKGSDPDKIPPPEQPTQLVIGTIRR